MPEIFLPTFHEDQVRAYLLKEDARGGEWARNAGGRFKAIRCGRRWGKTEYGKTVACDGAAKSSPIGWFAPDYKIISEAFTEIAEILQPIKRSANKIDGLIRTTTAGRIDFWTLNNERAGRSRKYKKIVIDEAAFTAENMMDIWQRSIMPTLLDLEGSAVVLSNSNGADPANFFWRICNEPEHGFIEYHAPTHKNPFMPKAELERLERETPPLVFRQEYLAEFIDWSGVAFFALDKLLDSNGLPYPMPVKCDAIFAVIDSATKTGKEHDGTAVSYWAIIKHLGIIICVDWDIVQIEGALLETWLPTVYQNLEAFAKQCGARQGSIGAWIEDAASGTILLQQSQRIRGGQAHAIDSKLTAMGKDERAISVSGYVYRGLVKMSAPAYDKTTTFKGQTRNHLLSQVLGFRIGDKEAAKRADDLADTFMYAIIVALGDNEGY